MRKLQVQHRDEVECLRLRLVGEDVRQDPFDLDATARCELGRLRQRDVGEVDGRHAPAALDEPDGVPPLAAGDVERPAGLELTDLGGEQTVRLGGPEELLLRVARVPVLAREARADRIGWASLLGHGRTVDDEALHEASRRAGVRLESDTAATWR